MKCVRPTGEGEGEVDVISDKECAKPKPKLKEKCICEQPPTTAMILPHKVKRLDLEDSLLPMFASVSSSRQIITFKVID